MAQGVSSYFDIGGKGGFSLRVFYSQDYNTAANQSTLSITKLQLLSGSWYGVTYYPSGTIKIDGAAAVTMSSTDGTHSVRVNSLNTWTDISGNLGAVTVNHNADGTKAVTIAVDVKVYTTSGSYGSGSAISGTQAVTLTTIPRVSKPSVSAASVEMGASVTIYTNRKSPEFVHALRYAFGNTSGYVCNYLEDSCTWTVPYDLAKQIPAAASGVVTIYCDTYYNNTHIGTETVEFTALVPDNDVTKPQFHVNFFPTGSVPGEFAGLYIQGKTGLRADFTASSNYSTIAGCAITVAGNTHGGNPAVSGVFATSGSIPVVCTVTDARGYCRSATVSVNVLPYSAPALNGVEVFRCDASGNAQTGGTYLHIRFTKQYSDVGGKNGCWVNLRTEEGGQYSGETTIVTSETAYDQILPNIVPDSEKVYHVQLLVLDNMGALVLYDFHLPSQFHTMHLKSGGKGIAFGKKSTMDGFECAMDAYFGAARSVEIFDDADGGSIRIHSPNNQVTHVMDAFDGNLRFYTFGYDVRYKACGMTADGVVHSSDGVVCYRIHGHVDNFLHVDLTNKNAWVNAPIYFMNEGGGGANQPVDGTFWGLREVFVPQTGGHALVRITEQYPMPGRMWFNVFDSGVHHGWSGWKSLTPV